MPLIHVADPRAQWALSTFGATGLFFLLLTGWDVVIDGDGLGESVLHAAVTALVFGVIWGGYLYWQLRHAIREDRAGPGR